MIGVFDSGVGGLTVLKELLNKLPQYDYAYFGDTARTPYGNKSPEAVRRYAVEDARLLVERGAQLLVVACNTMSALAMDDGLGKEFPDLPKFEVITPAVEEALRISRKHRIGVLATRATVNSGIYQRLIRGRSPQAQVFAEPAPLLVPLVEENRLDRPETRRIIASYVRPLIAKGVDTVILGCTHYPLLYDVIRQKVGRSRKLVNSAAATAERVKAYLAQHPEVERKLTRIDAPSLRRRGEGGSGVQLLFSDVTEQTREIARRWLRRDVPLERVSL